MHLARVSLLPKFLLSATFALFSSIGNATEFDNSVNLMWQKYLSESQALTSLKNAHDAYAIQFGDKIMKFTMDKLGAPDANGYPLYIALHGGGGAPAWLNDSQWAHMSIYYKSSVSSGVYVAPRGVTDTWNLHFVDESYPLYDRLIEDMVMYEGVDPNRVYFLGFSAGGDGVYQVVPRMPDRFAAANMSAGHHNWINFDNLYNTPFVIQVGELDSAFKRNTVAAENYLTLQNLNQKYGGGYVTDLFVHANYGHNGWPDNNPSRPMANVIADGKKWLESNDHTTKRVNSNAIDWVNQYTRNPVPTKLVWDLSTRAARTTSAGQEFLNAKGDAQTTLAVPRDLFYWLDVSVAQPSPEVGKLVVELNKAKNELNVMEATGVNKFRVLLNEHMLDLSKPIVVMVDGQLVKVMDVKTSTQTMNRTLLERSDKNFVFNAELVLSRQNNNTWTAE